MLARIAVALSLAVAVVVAGRLMLGPDVDRLPRDRQEMATLEQAIESFRLDMGRYPSEAEGLDALTAAPAEEPRWAGPYLTRNHLWLERYRYGLREGRPFVESRSEIE